VNTERTQLTWWIEESTNDVVRSILEEELEIFRLMYLTDRATEDEIRVAKTKARTLLNDMGQDTRTIFQLFLVTGRDFIPADSVEEAELVFADDPTICCHYFHSGKHIIQVRKDDKVSNFVDLIDEKNRRASSLEYFCGFGFGLYGLILRQFLVKYQS